MKLSTTLDYSGGFLESVKTVKEFESAGLDLVWVAEAYGFDAVSLMGYLAGQTERIEIGSGILPIYSRTPALLTMTAAGVDALSKGRCVLGLGASGPQVIEGFHGVRYDKPLARTARSSTYAGRSGNARVRSHTRAPSTTCRSPRQREQVSANRSS